MAKEKLLEMCKLIANNPDPIKGTNDFHAEHIELLEGTWTLEKQIQEDKKYGVLTTPTNEIKYFLINGKGGYMSLAQEKKAVNIPLTQLDLLVETDMSSTRIGSEADLTVKFMSTKEDKFLTRDTLAYHGYPFGSLRGICVINKDFIYTPDGETRLGSDLIKHGIPVQFPDTLYKTWDLDQILRHEFGHGIPGLPHSPNDFKMMSPSYGKMSEFYDDETKARIWAKMPKRKWNSKLFQIISFHMRRKSDFY